MSEKTKKIHYIYKTTNLINKKYYIGMHITNNLNDGYVGSGKRLWYSIKKYGKENFNCEILEILPNRSSLKKREKELVNEDLLKDPLCMNLTIGGNDGFYYINKNGINNKSNQYLKGGRASAEKLKNDPEYRERHREWVSKNSKLLWKNGLPKPFNWLGYKHKEETKRKIGEANSKKQEGSKNSQFGSCWITNGVENKKIKKTDELPNGWIFGRKIKIGNN